MKKFILFTFLAFFALQSYSQIDSTVFKHETKTTQNGIQMETKMFLSAAFTYADSIDKEVIYLQAANLVNEESLAEMEAKINILEKEQEQKRKLIKALRFRLQEIVRIASDPDE